MTITFTHSADDYAKLRYAPNLAGLLEELQQALFGESKVDGCEVNLLNDSGTALVTAFLKLPEAFSGIQRTYQGFQYPLNLSDANAKVFKSGVPALITEKDLGHFNDTTRMRFERWKIHSLFVLPLIVQLKGNVVKTVGTITVFSQNNVFEKSSIQHFQTLADLYGPQIRIYWEHHQAIEYRKTVDVMYAEMQQFVKYITKMNSLTAVEEVFASIGSEFIERFHFDMVSILLAEDDELAMAHTSFSKDFEHLMPKWEPFRQATRYSLSVRDGQSAMLYLSNQRFLVQDAMQIMHLPMSEKDRGALTTLETPRTFMIVPIRLNGIPIGIMWLASLGNTLDLPEAELTLIELLASFISTAIRNAQAHMTVEAQKNEIGSLNEELKIKIALLDQVARKDRLTGLNNFGNFEDELRRRTSAISRGGGVAGALSAILLDIDHFKRFNDTFGHPAGNLILQSIGERISKAVRDMDFVARYGGEEFVVLLPQCDLSGAAVIAERIRRKIDEEPIVVDGQPHHITVSGGCAQFHGSENSDGFISRADQALYEAKHHGRNRIEVAD